ncbi:MAG: hypothetical protein ACM3KR_07355 [Deltaproteobacteria bacterium]
MKNNDCSKEKIVEAYYAQSTNHDALKHINSCEECSKYYQDLVAAGEKMNTLNMADNYTDTFAVKKIVNIHLARKQKKRIIREAVLFSLFGLVFLGGLYWAMITINYMAALIFYLIIFINLPILLLPVILKRKELL